MSLFTTRWADYHVKTGTGTSCYIQLKMMKTGESAVEQQPRLHLGGNSTEPQPGFSRTWKPLPHCTLLSTVQFRRLNGLTVLLKSTMMEESRIKEWGTPDSSFGPHPSWVLESPECRKSPKIKMSRFKISWQFHDSGTAGLIVALFNKYDCLSLFVRWFVLFSVKMQLNRNDKSRIQNKTLLISIRPRHNMIAYVAKQIKNNINIISVSK